MLKIIWVMKTTREEFAAIMYFNQNIGLIIDVIAWNGVINSYCALCCEEKRGQNRAEDANSVFMCCVVISYVMLLFMHVVNVMFTTLLLRTFSWYKQQMPELTLGLYLLLVRTDFSNWWSSLYTIFFKFTHSKVIL